MDIKHLKQVSRIKHFILEKYLPPWTTILGSYYERLCYFDCYAGPGKYESGGEIVDGSPIIAVKSAEKFLSKNPKKEMILVLVEEDQEQLDSLEIELNKFKPYPKGLKVFPINEDAPTFVSEILEQTTNLAPSFFLVDPYFHPLSIPILNDILSRKRTEALINCMYYQFHRDVSNPVAEPHISKMFGHEKWKEQEFISLKGYKREKKFLEYFLGQINAKYKFPFRVLFDPEDKNKQSGTKYYLIHASNHPKAVLLMKEVMWKLGDQEGTFEYSATKTLPLFSETPEEDNLKKYLMDKFKGQKITFDDLRINTWFLPYIERSYRATIQEMKKAGIVKVTLISSKKEGALSKNDIIEFI